MKTGLRHIPNALTILRVIAAAIFPLVEQEWWLSLITLALVTEYLDGTFSRQFHWGSAFGRILDPIADKLFFIAVAIAFYLDRRLAPMDILLLAVRDITIIVGAVWLLLRGYWQRWSEIAPNFAGKLTTAAQYLTFFSCFLLVAAKPWLVGLTFVLGSVAAMQYFSEIKRISRGGRGGVYT